MNPEGAPSIADEVTKFSRTNEENFAPTVETLKDFNTKVSEIFPPEDARVIDDAIMLMSTLHINQKDRPNGNPYMDHILSVSKRVLEMTADNPDKDLVIAALLHDSVEDQGEQLAQFSETKSNGTTNESALAVIQNKYGERVAGIVSHLSNPDFDAILAEQGIDENNPNYAELKRNLYADHVKEAIENPDVFIIKLSDFIDNALSLDSLPVEDEKQRQRKAKLVKKYLPVMTIFSKKLAESGQFPEIKTRLDETYEKLSE